MNINLVRKPCFKSGLQIEIMNPEEFFYTLNCSVTYQRPSLSSFTGFKLKFVCRCPFSVGPWINKSGKGFSVGFAANNFFKLKTFLEINSWVEPFRKLQARSELWPSTL